MKHPSFSGMALRLYKVWATMLLPLFAAVPGLARAHDVPPSIVMLDIGRSAIDVELQLPLSELGAALGLPLTSTPDRVVPQYGDRIERYVTERMQLHSADGRPYTLRIESLGMRATDNVNLTSNDWLIVNATLRAPKAVSTEVFALDFNARVERDPMVRVHEGYWGGICGGGRSRLDSRTGLRAH